MFVFPDEVMKVKLYPSSINTKKVRSIFNYHRGSRRESSINAPGCSIYLLTENIQQQVTKSQKKTVLFCLLLPEPQAAKASGFQLGRL